MEATSAEATVHVDVSLCQRFAALEATSAEAAVHVDVSLRQGRAAIEASVVNVAVYIDASLCQRCATFEATLAEVAHCVRNGYARKAVAIVKSVVADVAHVAVEVQRFHVVVVVARVGADVLNGHLDALVVHRPADAHDARGVIRAIDSLARPFGRSGRHVFYAAHFEQRAEVRIDLYVLQVFIRGVGHIVYSAFGVVVSFWRRVAQPDDFLGS